MIRIVSVFITKFFLLLCPACIVIIFAGLPMANSSNLSHRETLECQTRKERSCRNITLGLCKGEWLGPRTVCLL
ncbi:uncharacterized protein BKA55DRAFT_581005 [Fusarium redolens]|uniref:Uncharacterized protein n=1 Tax=Fusarium redolens TaxID=48865 RepID=A0A9P9JXE9_FUSRE|nr:uncharacterized protein BKA55DRAFT_581005 [Fusarium redolens]KAH7232349.1 hypothetical protein BKA55DRAFT_581005 [Fusarium redolens]